MGDDYFVTYHATMFTSLHNQNTIKVFLRVLILDSFFLNIYLHNIFTASSCYFDGELQNPLYCCVVMVMSVLIIELI